NLFATNLFDSTATTACEVIGGKNVLVFDVTERQIDAARKAPLAVPPSASASRRDLLPGLLVALELHRLSASKEEVAIIDAQIDEVHAQLRDLPDGVWADRLATTRLILALDARADTLVLQLQHARTVFTEAHPQVQGILNQLKPIVERRAELVKSK